MKRPVQLPFHDDFKIYKQDDIMKDFQQFTVNTRLLASFSFCITLHLIIAIGFPGRTQPGSCSWETLLHAQVFLSCRWACIRKHCSRRRTNIHYSGINRRARFVQYVVFGFWCNIENISLKTSEQINHGLWTLET